MKKFIFILCLLFQLNLFNSEYYSPEKYILNTAIYLYMKANDLTEAVCNTGWVKSLLSYIDISDKSLSSDELVIIIPKDDNTFNIKLLNLYKINLSKDKFEVQKEWIEINRDLYEKIRKLSLPNLGCVLENDIWNIKLPNDVHFKLKAESKIVEVVILPNRNLGPIVEELYQIDQ